MGRFQKQRLTFRFDCGFVVYQPCGSAPSPEQIAELEEDAQNQHHLLCTPGCEAT